LEKKFRDETDNGVAQKQKQTHAQKGLQDRDLKDKEKEKRQKPYGITSVQNKKMTGIKHSEGLEAGENWKDWKGENDK